jgi:hypothetical protein
MHFLKLCREFGNKATGLSLAPFGKEIYNRFGRYCYGVMKKLVDIFFCIH